MRKTIGIALISLIFMSTLITTIGPLKASGKFIDTSFHNGVVVDCPTYVAGVKNINVYTNKTVQNYELRLNGTLLNSKASPKRYINGRWYTDTEILNQGENQAGNLRYCDVQDTNYLYCQSQTVAVAWLLGIPVDYDEFIYNQFCWGTGNKDTTYINATWIEYRIQLTRQSSLNDKVLQYWRTSDSTWQTFVTLTENAWNTGNVSLAVMSNIGSIDKAFWMRVYCRDSDANDEIQVNVDYLRIYYTSTQVLSNDRDYTLVDTYAFNSSAKADGVYNLTARVKDFAGTWWNDMKWIVVDNTNPTIGTITVVSHPTGGLNNTIPISITTTITDTYLNNSYGQYSNGYNVIQIPNAASTIFNYTAYFTNRTYNFYIYATDNAGNIQSKNKSFVVTYKQEVLYVQNPVIDISADKKQFVNNTAAVVINMLYVKQLKIYVNGTLNYTSGLNPTFKNFTLFYRTSTVFVVKMRFEYSNGTFFKNITVNVQFILPTYVYISNPSIDIKAQEQKYVNETGWVNTTCKYVNQVKVYVNGTLNYTSGSNPTSVNRSFTYHVQATLLITLRFTYSNGTFYKNITVTMRFINPTYIYVQYPEIAISSQKYQYVNETAWVNITCARVWQIKGYVNSTLNFTSSSYPASVNTSFVYHHTTRLDIMLRFTYSNGTFFKNISVVIYFINYTYIYLHAPCIAIAATLLTNITDYNYLVIATEHLGGMNMTIYSWTNMTTTLTNYANTTSLLIPLKSFVIDVWNITLYFNYPNGSLYTIYSIGMGWDDWTIVHEYINEPIITIDYIARSNITSTAWVNMTCQYLSSVSFYVNGTLNSTYPTPSQINFGFNSSTVQTFNLTIETFYENATWFKNFTMLIEFYNGTILTRYIHEPLISILYNNLQNITRTAWVNVTCENVGRLKYFINGTLNSTFNSPSQINFGFNSSTVQTFNLTIQSFYTNLTWFKSFTLLIQFYNGTILTEYIYEPTVLIGYDGLQNITKTAWINISCSRIGRINLYLNNTYNSSYVLPSVISFGLNSSTVQAFNVTIQSFYENSTFYKNFTILITFFNGTRVYITQPSINIAYQSIQNITRPALINITCQNIGRIKIFLNGTINATKDSPLTWNYSLNSSIVQTFNVTIESFYENLTFYKNTTLIVQFFNGTRVYITQPSINIAYQSIQNITRPALINITCQNIGRIKIFLNGTINATKDSPLTWNYSLNSSIVQTFGVVIQTFYTNLTQYQNFTFSVSFYNWTILTYYREPCIQIIAQSLQNITNNAWINVTIREISQIKFYVNNTLNATYSGSPTSVNFSLYSSTPCLFNVVMVSKHANGSFYRNFSIPIEFFNATHVDHYIKQPSVNILYQASQNISHYAWINITTQEIGRLKYFVNGTINATYDSPATTSVNYSIYSSTIQTFNITVQSFYTNLTWYKNYTMLITFFNGTFVQNNITNVWVNLVYPSEKYFDQDAWLNITCQGIGRIKFFVNGTYNSTFNLPTSINFSIGAPLIVTTYNITVVVFYANLSAYRNFTAIMAFKNYTYVNVYVQNPSLIVGYTADRSIGETAWINTTCDRIGKIKLWINGTLNQTIISPVLYNFSIIYNTPTLLNFVVESFYLNDTFFKNASGSIIFINYTHIMNPFITISYNSQTQVGNTARANFTCEYIGQLKVWVNGTLNSTTNNPSIVRLNITSSILSKYNITARITYENSTFYKNVSFIMEFVNVTTKIHLTIFIPSYSIVYPGSIFVSSMTYILITTSRAKGYYLNITINGVFKNSTFYAGNTTSVFLVPRYVPGNVTYAVKVLYPNSTIYSIVNFVVFVINITIPRFIVNIGYVYISYKGYPVIIYGDFSFAADTAIILNEYNQTTTYNDQHFMIYTFYVPSNSPYSSLTLNVTVTNGTIRVYQRTFTILLVAKPSGGGMQYPSDMFYLHVKNNRGGAVQLTISIGTRLYGLHTIEGGELLLLQLIRGIYKYKVTVNQQIIIPDTELIMNETRYITITENNPFGLFFTGLTGNAYWIFALVGIILILAVIVTRRRKKKKRPKKNTKWE
jgi:hypothetical protein